MFKNNENNFKKLKELYSMSETKTSIVFVKGDKGLGKTTFIDFFIKHYKEHITILSNKEYELYLKTFENAVSKYYGNEINTNAYIFDGLSYSEIISKNLLSVFSLNSKILFVQDIEQCSLDFIDFLRKICNVLIKDCNKNAFIILECNTNTKEYGEKKR